MTADSWQLSILVTIIMQHWYASMQNLNGIIFVTQGKEIKKKKNVNNENS